jgi:hypothetical protein
MGYIPKPTAAQKQNARNTVFNSSFNVLFKKGDKFQLVDVTLREEDNTNKETKKDKPKFDFWVIRTSLGPRHDLTLGLLYNPFNSVADTETNRGKERVKDFILYPVRELTASVANSLSAQIDELVKAGENDLEKVFTKLVEQNKGKTFVCRREQVKVENNFSERPFTSTICDFIAE